MLFKDLSVLYSVDPDQFQAFCVFPGLFNAFFSWTFSRQISISRIFQACLRPETALFIKNHV